MKQIRDHNEELLEMFKTGSRVTYARGETIIRPEETPQGVFLIEEGFVKSFDITKYGDDPLIV